MEVRLLIQQTTYCCNTHVRVISFLPIALNTENSLDLLASTHT